MDSRFELRGELGSGGFGAVHRAFDRKLGREVALKVLHNLDTHEVARFLEEARALVRIDDPGVVKMLDADVDRGRPFMVMELVRGETLEARVARGPFELREAARLGIEIARILEHLHAKGVVHRDLKPANALIQPDGKLVLLDLGLALLLDRSARLSRSGEAIGTPHFMPPEQAEGRSRDMGPAADVYGLGATLFALLTGRPPFDGPTCVQVIEAVIGQAPPAPSSLRPGLGPGLDRIVLACLAKDPLDRPDLPEVRAALAAPDRGAPGTRRAPLAIAGALGLLAAGAAAFFASGRPASGQTEATIALILSGDAAYRGEGVPRDPAAAARYYRLAAEAGDPDGMACLGALLIKGEGVAADPHEAARLLERAADLGNGRAMCSLGALYEDGGPGFEPDLERAVELYRRSAAAGWSNAMVLLANLSFDGKGMPRSDAEGVRWLEAASAAGSARATTRLARLHERGAAGLPKDAAAAERLIARATQQRRVAAQAGDVEAMTELALALFFGRGVARDPLEAGVWWSRALVCGDASARYWLGVLNFDGAATVKRDLTRAEALFTRVDDPQTRPWAGLYLYLMALELGNERAGREVLLAVRGDGRGWADKVIATLLGVLREEELLAAIDAGDSGETGGPRGRRCVATFYLGARHALTGDRERGEALLRECVATGFTDFPQHGSARAMLARLAR